MPPIREDSDALVIVVMSVKLSTFPLQARKPKAYWPNHTPERRRITLGQECIHFLALIVSMIVIISDGRIHHHHIVLLAVLQIFDEILHLVDRKSVFIQSEDSSMVHVVNVRPYCPELLLAAVQKGFS